MNKIKTGLWVLAALFVLMGIVLAIEATGAGSWQQAAATITASDIAKRTQSCENK